MKWPVLFGPSELFGTFFGWLLSLAGIIAFLLMILFTALQSTAWMSDPARFGLPTEIYCNLAGLSSLLSAWVLYRPLPCWKGEESGVKTW